MCVALAYVNSPQRMRQRYAYGSNIAAVRCGWEDRIMSNGESKSAIFKAALCCGFAIALRALFIGDSVMLSEAKHLYAWNLKRFYLSVIASIR